MTVDMNKTIGYTILACNEAAELNQLLLQLLKYKQEHDEIHVILDEGNTTAAVLDVVSEFNDKIHVYTRPLNKDFAAQKNYVASMCTTDYIFNIDADELLGDWLISNVNSILSTNSDVDTFHIPRINIVTGITPEHINKWRWNVNAQKWINFPDYQQRIYKNTPDIKWCGVVHERLIGNKSQGYLPTDEECCIIHVKDIERQEIQNNFYGTIG